MTGRQKYRRLVIIMLILSLAGFLTAGYLYLKNQVPDQILVEEGSSIRAVFQEPLNALIEEEAVEAGSSGASDIPQDQLHRSRGQIRCSLLGMIPLKTVQVEAVERQSVYAGGFPVGIYLETDGVLVIGTGQIQGADGHMYEPAEHIIETGDYIIGVNGKLLKDKEELVECINASGGRKMEFQVLRDGKQIDLSITPVQTQEHQYRAGIWVRSDAQGVGTLTYTDEEGKFGALGHGISDVDTSTLLSLKQGKLYQADVVSVVKGEKGSPGELAGIIHYHDGALLGNIEENRSTGIYGVAENWQVMEQGELMEVAYKQEVQRGEAVIRCCVDGTVKEYAIEIENVDLNKKEVNKGMVIRVTDEELLKKTGGIVQGMSGSPIIQNGRVVGAVTHVFVQDPTRGYGIFIENMLERA